MKKNTISIKGAYPPRIGGISVHNARLASTLADDGMLGCVYSISISGENSESRINVKSAHYPWVRYEIIRSLLWFLNDGIRDRSKIIHLHGHPAWESPTLLLLLLSGKRLVYTIHDQMMFSNPEEIPKLMLYLFKKALRKKRIRWIAVNNNIKLQLIGLNADSSLISVIPAYVPTKIMNGQLNAEIEDFMGSRSKILSVYANTIRNLNNKDLYGIDLAIRALAKVKTFDNNVGLVISIPNEDRTNLINAYTQIIEELKLSENVLLFLKPVNDPLKLWRCSDIVLRPTLTDGDSLVVREAISQNTYLIASDCVERPSEAILFKSEDVEDLVVKIIETLKKESKTNTTSTESNYSLLKDVYNSLLHS
ncbi:MAG: glycosyltransferase [Bacteroidales bacterium]|nr:glycosyltransferase [Bacteroidales bacterium]